MLDSKVREKNTVTIGQKLSLGLGDLGYSMVSNTMSSYIMFFGNTVMGVPGTLMGLAVACGTMWDAVTDPLVGYISDNAKPRLFGRRHMFILAGVLMIAVMNILLWSVPRDWSAWAKFGWFAVGIILLETGHTLFATPNNALSIEISSSYNERSSIQGYKSIFAILGILLPTLLMGVFQSSTSEYPDGRFNPQAYLNFGYIASASIAVLGTVLLISTFSHVPRLRALQQKEKPVLQKDKGLGIFKAFFSSLKVRSFRSVILGYSVAMMAATIIVAVGFNVFTFTFKTTTMQMYIIMAGLFIMTIVGQPLWLYISRKLDKRVAVLGGLSVALLGCIMLFAMFLLRDTFNALLEKSFFYVFAMTPPLMVAGLGVGVLFSMPLALIGDAIVIEKASSGQDKTATYTGFMTLAYKASQAVSQLLLGIMLDLVGFQEGSTVQTPEVEAALGWMLCIGVTVAIVGGILIFARYNVTRAEVQEALNKISSISESTEESVEEKEKKNA